MITKISYQIRFITPVIFKNCPKFIIYKKIISSIKRTSCLTITKNCLDCQMTQSCVYFYISGENFTKYPGLGIKRNLIDKMNYKSKDILNFDLWVLGDCSIYNNYISIALNDNFLRLNKQDILYQVIAEKKEIIDETKINKYNSTVITPSEIDIEQFNYYNDNYNTNFPKVDITFHDKRLVTDKRNYYLDNKNIKLYGFCGEIAFNNESLYTIGFGKNNYIGGGTIDENKD